MTAKELVTQIESAGGQLTITADGALLCQGASAELTNQLQPMKANVIHLLQERNKPRRYSSLFTNEELIAMRERYEAQQRDARVKEYATLTAAAPMTPKPYQSRSVEQWELRVPKTRAEILLEVYRDYPDMSTQELSEAASRSQRWVRKVLRENGVPLPARNGRKQPAERELQQ